MKNTNKVKAMLRIAGAVALVAAAAFSFTSCAEPGEGGAARVPSNSTYTWTGGGNSYRLTITEPDGTGRAVTKGNFVLVVTKSDNSTVVITGTATGSDNSFSLTPSGGGSAIPVTISGSTIMISATISGVTISGGSNLTVEPGKAPSASGDKLRIEDYVVFDGIAPTTVTFGYYYETGTHGQTLTSKLLSGEISGSPSVRVNNGKLSISLDAPKPSALAPVGTAFGAGVTVSDTNAKLFIIQLFSTNATQGTGQLLWCLRTPTHGVMLLYTDRDVNITGTTTETDNGHTYNTVLQMNLKKGWNFMEASTTSTSTTNTSTLKASTAMPSGFYWTVIAAN